MVDKPLFGVFRQVLGIQVCYGGPTSKKEALATKRRLESQMSFVNEQELRRRKFEVARMSPGTLQLYWDGRFRSS